VTRFGWDMTCDLHCIRSSLNNCVKNKSEITFSSWNCKIDCLKMMTDFLHTAAFLSSNLKSVVILKNFKTFFRESKISASVPNFRYRTGTFYIVSSTIGILFVWWKWSQKIFRAYSYKAELFSTIKLDRCWIIYRSNLLETIIIANDYFQIEGD